MNENKNLIIIIGIIGIIIFFIILSKNNNNNNNNNNYPLGLNTKAAVSGLSGFTNVKKSNFKSNFQFGETSYIHPSVSPWANNSTYNPDLTVNSLTTYPDGNQVNVYDNWYFNLPGFLELKTPSMKAFFIIIGNYYNNYYPPISRQISIALDMSEDDMINQIKNVNDPVSNSQAILNCLATLRVLEDNLENLVKKQLTTSDNTHDIYLPIIQYSYVCKYFLNFDIINRESSIGNGWKQYYISETSVTKDTDITPYDLNAEFFGKPLKSIIITYAGKEDNTTPTASKILFTGKDNNENTLVPTWNPYDLNAPGRSTKTSQQDVNNPPKTVITDLSTYTAWFDDPGSYNYGVYILSLNYPVTLKKLSIQLTCPGTSASITEFYLAFIYV